MIGRPRRIGVKHMHVPEFMSADHVSQMNLLLRDSVAVHQAAAALGGRHALTYRLEAAPTGVEYWTFEVTADGARFHLDAPTSPPDVMLSADWTEMMRTSRALQEGREVEPVVPEMTGDPEMFAKLQQVLEIAGTVATIRSHIAEV